MRIEHIGLRPGLRRLLTGFRSALEANLGYLCQHRFCRVE
jgi:hypothetical protein